MTSRLAGAAPTFRDEERELLHRCRLGSEAAYAELIGSANRPLFTLAVRLVGSSSVAEDLVRGTFVEAFRAIERREERLPLVPWIARLCVRRARRRAGSGPLGGRVRAASGRERGLGTKHDLAACVAALPFEQRAVLALRFGMGLGADDVALALGIDRDEVRRRLTNALAEFRASEWGAAPEAADEPRPIGAAAPYLAWRRFAGRKEV